MSDYDLQTVGMDLNIRTEEGKDDYKYGENASVRVAGQQDFDNY